MLPFDHNLSRLLVARLSDVFPGAESTASAGLADSPDADVWTYEEGRDLVIVTKDSDFNDLAVLHGPPPHVVWIQRGNCSAVEIEGLLRDHADTIRGVAGSQTAVLVLR
ncbi:DUF5615 family PIN-like protein [Rubrivirga marina]|uniref:DUF5615 domain-containing protein n=1 Tax=Rubrivirga marina TaxID=1196024 RepID=A0A271J079_9BACT|nr:DUF5615 family PIN-like protein [Rubrivirga marina]PAP76454.1 hypothetical protein BSZ37_08370 [Rubrivirga marina]